MIQLIRFLMLILMITACNGQAKKQAEKVVGGPCEDCEAALDYKLMQIELKAIDTLLGFNEKNPKMKISGTVYQSDGKTPAENVILYIYQTGRDGIYEPSENPIGWEQRHGKFRSWLKTGADGQYSFYTFRPAPYPQVQESAHIHMYIKESDKIPYYIDNFIFLDDPTLTEEDKNSQNLRGGSGLISLSTENGLLIGKRDIVLGLHIPDYEN